MLQLSITLYDHRIGATDLIRLDAISIYPLCFNLKKLKKGNSSFINITERFQHHLKEHQVLFTLKIL